MEITEDVVDQAREFVLCGQFARGRALLDDHLGEHPDDARAWHLLAGALIGLGRSRDAVGAADRSVSLDPDDPVAYRMRAIARVALRDRVRPHEDARQGPARDHGNAGTLALLTWGLLMTERVPAARNLARRSIRTRTAVKGLLGTGSGG
ncbi:tetratricopeptide repeat protein [Actinoplanes sp. NPDC026623]|uniref:tetratricopeptide repeat protein n=1 Tax=Actinoplanes sp. NPDC026623 TaxID=3155610 RepID=UPI0033F876EA